MSYAHTHYPAPAPGLAAQRTFTTGEVGRLLEVSDALVKRWIDSGLLPGYRLPRPGAVRAWDRRVTREALVAFLEAHGMPPFLGPREGAPP